MVILLCKTEDQHYQEKCVRLFFKRIDSISKLSFEILNSDILALIPSSMSESTLYTIQISRARCKK